MNAEAAETGDLEKREGNSQEMVKEVNLVIIVVWLSVFLLPTTPAMSADIYQWKDKNGKIHFSDTPPPSEVDAEIIQFKKDSLDKPKTKEDSPKAKSFRRIEKRSYGDVNVIMYMTSWCGYCRKAREYLLSLGVNLIEYDVERDKVRREEMLQKSGGSTGVPLIDVEGIIVKGFRPDSIKAAVEKRRGL
jgi:glutaredoxin